ncbi:hypothetical protein DRN32_01750 [Thermococci archaeon]|nr:MAG: hypothetical protein DRN32_01750 [Thermococci archaeon]
MECRGLRVISVREIIKKRFGVGWKTLGALVNNGYLKIGSTFEPVIDMTDIHLACVWEDDHLPCVSLFFRDEKGRLRYAEVLFNEFGPGMVVYAPDSDVAKRDLIREVNRFYSFESRSGREMIEDWGTMDAYVCCDGGRYFTVVDNRQVGVRVAFCGAEDLHLFRGSVEWQMETDVGVKIADATFNTPTDALAWYLYKGGLVKRDEARSAARILLILKSSQVLRT